MLNLLGLFFFCWDRLLSLCLVWLTYPDPERWNIAQAAFIMFCMHFHVHIKLFSKNRRIYSDCGSWILLHTLCLLAVCLKQTLYLFFLVHQVFHSSIRDFAIFNNCVLWDSHDSLWCYICPHLLSFKILIWRREKKVINPPFSPVLVSILNHYRNPEIAYRIPLHHEY